MPVIYLGGSVGIKKLYGAGFPKTKKELKEFYGYAGCLIDEIRLFLENEFEFEIRLENKSELMQQIVADIGGLGINKNINYLLIGGQI